ncbi:hypothetical protein SSP24_49480 [Streptomyces spinoverrucosus]|uniref:Uncharacterized protein n=1 Tax=Streptomyces spinoverrucosus TaxID=284043 RepID=A0A4Y3VL63_9ACTN|nr:hypothetical protein [Streptomyces spinoverrucosus]GEC07293.1 hypothetical protein SSP24_49480 [Streptomyces spinoverrucosus]GHB91010.1 hypothetical protein GCM10010397_74150 [Streptomyces spinoverrucosus]
MTVDRDGRGGFDSDPLMAVITGERLPDAARADAAFMAEHRSAAADVALLRQQLGLIGEALTEEAPEEPSKAPSPPVRIRPHRRRPFALALGAVGVAAAGAMVVGLGWLLGQAGGGVTETSGAAADSAESDSSSTAGPLGSPEYLACARLVAEGEVTDTHPVPGTGEERVTLEVTHSYKPTRGNTEITFAIPTSAGLDKGEQILIAIRRDSATPDFWLAGETAIAAQRPLLIETLPQAGTTPCE